MAAFLSPLASPLAPQPRLCPLHPCFHWVPGKLRGTGTLGSLEVREPEMGQAVGKDGVSHCMREKYITWANTQGFLLPIPLPLWGTTSQGCGSFAPELLQHNAVQTWCELVPLNSKLSTEIQKDWERVVENAFSSSTHRHTEEQHCSGAGLLHTGWELHTQKAPFLNTGGEHRRTRMTLHQSSWATGSLIKSASETSLQLGHSIFDHFSVP